MRKKTLLIPTLMALFCGVIGSAPGAFAKTEILGTNYWSVPELLALNEEVEAEMGIDCASDAFCADDYRRSLFERGGEYRALEKLMFSPFAITAINPDEGTIKAFYNDKAIGFYESSGQNPKERALRQIYSFWTEPGTENDPWDSNNNILFHANLKYTENKAVPGVHSVIEWDEEVMGYFPSKQEVLFYIGDPALPNNKRGHIYYSIGLDNVGASIFADCLNNSEYKKNTECQAVYGEDMEVTYIPVGGIDEPTPDEPTPDEPTPDESIIDEPAPDNLIIDEPISEEPIIEEPTVDNLIIEDSIIDKPILEELNQNSSQPLTENTQPASELPSLTTGKPTNIEISSQLLEKKQLTSENIESESGEEEEIDIPFSGNNNMVMSQSEEKTVDFPWWIVVIIIIGDILLAWCFVPSNHQRHKKR